MLKSRTWLIPPALFLLVVILFYPFRFTFEFDTDEGLQVIDALLQNRGYRLYQETYRDQPPVLTLLLSVVFALFGYKVTLARIVVLCTSGLLIGAASYYLNRIFGPAHAVGGLLAFLLLPYYTRLSVSVMIGLPSIAFAMIAFTGLSMWHDRSKTSWLLLSGAAFGLSLMTKAFTVILGPVFVAGLLLPLFGPLGSRRWRSALGPLALWVGSASAVLVAIALLVIGPRQLEQLVNLPLGAQGIDPFVERATAQDIHYYLRDSWEILVAALVGGALALRRRIWTAAYMLLWAVSAYAALTIVVPVWYHHQVLITVPAAVLLAILFGESVGWVRRMTRGALELDRSAVLSGLGLAAAVWVLYLRVPKLVSHYRLDLPNLRPAADLSDRDFEVLAIMSEYREKTDLVVADRPMFAFRLEKSVPPELALFSEKRLLSGLLTEADIIRVIERERPEQVALTRFHLPQVESHLQQDYRLVYGAGKHRLYIHQDLLEE